MKKIFTLGALGLLASFGAQAQITVDGRIMAGEVGSGAGQYQSMGMYTADHATGAGHGYGPWGLKEAYVGEDANFIYIGINGTVEQNGNSFYLFFNASNQPMLPACQPLPPTMSATGDPTAFMGFNHTLELPVSAALALRVPAAGAGQLELCDYRATPIASVLGPLATDGTPGSFATGGAIQSAYLAPTNAPNDITANTNEAWEIRVAKAAYMLATGMNIQLFVLLGNQGGDYLSSDFIPMSTDAAALGVNLDQGPTMTGANFCTDVQGTQYVTYQLGTGIVSGLKKVDAASLKFSVAPNPVNGPETSVNFTLDKAQTGSVTVTDLLGRQVAVLANGALPAGEQRFTLKAANLTAGQYIVKLQLGDKVATRKVAVL